ncbi:hypothetical protein KAR91_84715 [Candidatus Pacearchaeota archaeon]|nr:hypothetical protein [Candidatus Pacearchaeota archaeon]
MKTPAIIEGLTILENYRTDPDGFNLGAEHDILYVCAPDQPIIETDLQRLVNLGWHQPNRDCPDWSCFV